MTDKPTEAITLTLEQHCNLTGKPTQQGNIVGFKICLKSKTDQKYDEIPYCPRLTMERVYVTSYNKDVVGWFSGCMYQKRGE